MRSHEEKQQRLHPDCWVQLPAVCKVKTAYFAVGTMIPLRNESTSSTPRHTTPRNAKLRSIKWYTSWGGQTYSTWHWGTQHWTNRLEKEESYRLYSEWKWFKSWHVHWLSWTRIFWGSTGSPGNQGTQHIQTWQRIVPKHHQSLRTLYCKGRIRLGRQIDNSIS